MPDEQQRSETVLLTMGHGYSVVAISDEMGHYYELRFRGNAILWAERLQKIADTIERMGLDAAD